MLQTEKLSAAAVALLRHRVSTRDNSVTPANLEAYRELVRAGIMYPVSGFVGGPEANFRFTEEGWAKKDEWLSEPAQRS